MRRRIQQKKLLTLQYQNQNSGARRIKSATTAMAKYKITYKCGHQKEVQLFGKYTEREKKIAWYATIDCPDCEAENQKEMAEKAGLPQLTGSDKQVAWATKLRNNALDILNAQVAAISNEQNRTKAIAYRNEWIGKETSSSYWIDNRDEMSDLRSILNLIQNSSK